jgi:16S rRNA (guanine527-N7)-methyltransferase
MTFKEDVKKILDIELSAYQEVQFEVYYQYLIEYNEITNLTRITDKTDVYYKHFFDSLTVVKTIDINKVFTICDMGSGAGFPSIPIKIVFPHVEVTIVDALNKRIMFLSQLIEKLKLSDISLVHDRAEIFAIKHQEAFDLVTARALGNMSLITEMGLPMTKINKYFVALKALNYEQELKDAKNGIQLLGGKIEEIKTFKLPHDFGDRTHIVIQKIKHTNGYPRLFALMTKKPL